MEVIVVIVGILIAYNLEQWNDTRSDGKREIEILKELKAALAADLAEMKNNINGHELSILASKTVLEVIKDDLPYHDSLDVYFRIHIVLPRYQGELDP